ncbi:MAG: translation initiation factor IF-2 [Bacteroidia bacterium]|nr:translation initiation factor IF-2 [Bacteroidia bacterium]MCZ2277621.1 translation initiation factor IF-2 [Bacteroidia bacterium]
MAEKEVRISKIQKEFSIGLDHIIDFLTKKGFSVDKNPNAKISSDAYALLAEEFAKDKEIKKEAEDITREKLKKENTVIEAKSAAETPEIKEIEKETDVRESLENLKLEIAVKESKKRKTKKTEKVPETEIIKAKAKVNGPKIVDKIELEEKPKTKIKKVKTESEAEKKTEKKAKKPKSPNEETPAVETEAVEKKVARGKKKKEDETRPVIEETPVAASQTETEPVIAPQPEEVQPTEQEKVKEEPQKEEKEITYKPSTIERLTGPNIVGKIILPVEPVRKKPVATSSDDISKKKRKRTDKKVNIKAVEKKQPPKQSGWQKPTPDTRRPKRPEPVTEITDKDIQEQIKATLAKLSGGKSRSGAKIRKAKREAAKEEAAQTTADAAAEQKTIKVTEFVTANELAKLVDVPVTQIISACMSLGMFVSINQRLDAETLSVVAEEFGYKVEFVSAEVQDAIAEEEDKAEQLKSRPPIITVMGHVDHGKTSLLDYIRKANVIADEAGGITQHIGAYSVTMENNKKITFLDTPGHEAFTAMRARGAKITDVVIIVIAADDSVMPQTVEAINHAQAAGVPIVFAFNKMDKPGASADKIREQLSQMNILVEEWGGKFQTQEISAKSGMGIRSLLDKVIIEADMLDLKANPERNAKGTIIESSLDKGRGYIATVLVLNGTLRNGDVVLAGCYSGRVKAMFNERGGKIESAGPSTPAMILGLTGAPQAGDQFHVLNDEREARDIANKRLQLQREQGIRTHKHITLDEIGRRLAIGSFKELNIIVKGDVDGSIEALADSLLKLSTDEVQVNIIHKSVGAITESDVMLASASNAIIVGFQVRPTLNARKLAEHEQIDIRLYSIIYDAINEVKSAMEGMLASEYEEKTVCNVEVRETFKIPKVGTIAGCMVLDGKITRNTKIRVIRDGIVAFTGELASLKRFKDDVKEVTSGFECGLNIANYNDIKIGDIIEGYEQVVVKRTLV